VWVDECGFPGCFFDMPSLGRRSCRLRRALPLERTRLRLRCLPVLIALAGCAAAKVVPSADSEALTDLRRQLDAQSSMVSQQQRRIEELEVKLAALEARAQPLAAPAVPARSTVPATPRVEPRPSLKTIKLGAGRRLRRDSVNPVALAPRLPATVELREPDEDRLARLDVDPVVAREFDADHAWAEAVQKLNEGRHADAEVEFLAFVAAYPRHTAADNALYLAGLVRESRGECGAALPLFESVPLKYPAGDAVPQALLERGRCLRILGRKDESKAVLMQLQREHPDAAEAAQGKMLLQE
jgi:TolA-binding protein